jgi:PPM family protein phosphatase
VDVDTFSIETRPGDLFLICSDGLTSMVDDETILSEVARNRDDLQGAAKALVRAANKGGGEDNITVVFFEIGGDGDTERTIRLPPREEPDADEEATLDELDRVPVIETENGHAAREEPRGRGRGILIATVAATLLVCASGFVVWGLWRSHFVGAEADGHVAVYQGVPWNIVGNVHLYRTVYVSPLLTAQLSQRERHKLFDHSLRSEDSARAAVRRYEEQIGAR